MCKRCAWSLRLGHAERKGAPSASKAARRVLQVHGAERLGWQSVSLGLPSRAPEKKLPIKQRLIAPHVVSRLMLFGNREGGLGGRASEVEGRQTRRTRGEETRLRRTRSDALGIFLSHSLRCLRKR